MCHIYTWGYIHTYGDTYIHMGIHTYIHMGDTHTHTQTHARIITLTPARPQSALRYLETTPLSQNQICSRNPHVVENALQYTIIHMYIYVYMYIYIYIYTHT